MKKVILFSPNGYVGSIIKEKLGVLENIELFEITRKTQIDLIKGNYDILIYSAAVTSSRTAGAEQYIRDNALCAVTMTEFCAKHFIKKIIYLSTDEIYGQLNDKQVTEDVVMYTPNIYATTKYLAEKVIMESGISYYILRLPGIVGKKWGKSFIYRLIDMVIRNEKIVIYHADRDFNNVVDVEDLVDFIEKLVLRNDYEQSEVFLLGNMHMISLLELINYIKKVYCSHSKIECIETDDKRYFTLNVEKAVSYGYRSKSISQIIDELYQCGRGE